MTDRALALCNLPEGARVLDAGCGTGASAAHVRNKHGTDCLGLDGSPLLLGRARAADSQVPLVAGLAQQLPFAGRVFDAVMMECSLSLVPDQAAALRECHRVVRDDGWLLISDVYLRNPGRGRALKELPVRGCFTGAMGQKALLDLVEQAGWAVRAWEDHSNALTRFAVDLVWQYGSLDRFWELQNVSGADSHRVRAVMRKIRPGYCLLVARRRG